jgi:hypothetical protein
MKMYGGVKAWLHVLRSKLEIPSPFLGRFLTFSMDGKLCATEPPERCGKDKNLCLF